MQRTNSHSAVCGLCTLALR